MSECAEILATCEGLPNSGVVTVAEEMVDGISNLIDFGSELMFLAQCLNGIAGGVEDSGRDANDTARQLGDCARYLDDLTFRSNDSLRFLLDRISELIDEGP